MQDWPYRYLLSLTYLFQIRSSVWHPNDDVVRDELESLQKRTAMFVTMNVEVGLKWDNTPLRSEGVSTHITLLRPQR